MAPAKKHNGAAFRNRPARRPSSPPGCGQLASKRALEIAAAGRRDLLFGFVPLTWQIFALDGGIVAEDGRAKTVVTFV